MITTATQRTIEIADQSARETARGQPDGSSISDQAIAAGERGLYVYAIVRGESNCRLGLIGLDQREVYTIAEGRLCGLVHDCPATPYQSGDRPTLEAWILAHQRAVLAAEQRFGVILPMTFNMVVHGPDDSAAAESLRGWLAENHDRFVDLLSRLDGKAEFGVQILWDKEAVARTLVATDPTLQALASQIAGKPKGLSYMLAQQLAKATRAAMEAWAQRTGGDYYEQIRRCVDDVRVSKPGKGKDKQPMLLALSCLMCKDDPSLGETLDRIAAAPGITVRFTGPWPPYSFVSHG